MDLLPMLAVPGPLPPPAQDDRWAYEMKWDGVRAIVVVADGRLTILARSGRDVTAAYPELQGLPAALGADAVLDGEIVAFDDTGRVDFATLQPRMHVADPARARLLAAHRPVSLLLFDVLRWAGHPTVGLPYADRRAVLDRLAITGRHWRTPPVFTGGGADALAASAAHRLEGVVAKRLDSDYRPGTRSRSWVKIKHVRELAVVVGGWRPGAGRRAGTLGSLLVGEQRAGTGLVYVGHVGTGFTDEMLIDLSRRLGPAERSTAPFTGVLPRAHARDARWVEPLVTGEVAFTEWTPDGLMRAPVWRGAHQH